jgi:hypothetical protein
MWGETGIDGKIILKQTLRKYVSVCGLGSTGLTRQGPMAGSCEQNNGLSDSIKGKKFLDWLQ